VPEGWGRVVRMIIALSTRNEQNDSRHLDMLANVTGVRYRLLVLSDAAFTCVDALTIFFLVTSGTPRRSLA
jgi:hypothetical protein